MEARVSIFLSIYAKDNPTFTTWLYFLSASDPCPAVNELAVSVQIGIQPVVR